MKRWQKYIFCEPSTSRRWQTPRTVSDSTKSRLILQPVTLVLSFLYFGDIIAWLVASMTITVGVLALQGAFLEHLVLLKRAADYLQQHEGVKESFEFIEVRNAEQLTRCDALIIPGGESTTISLVAAQSGLLEPLREFVKYGLASPSPPCRLEPDGCLQSLP